MTDQYVVKKQIEVCFNVLKQIFENVLLLTISWNISKLELMTTAVVWHINSNKC